MLFKRCKRACIKNFDIVSLQYKHSRDKQNPDEREGQIEAAEQIPVVKQPNSIDTR